MPPADRQVAYIIAAAFRCVACGTSSVQPNDQCSQHVSLIDAYETERTMHAAWRKRAEEAEARERSSALPQGSEIHRVIEKWRKQAASPWAGIIFNEVRANTLIECADELSAVLAALAPPPGGDEPAK